MKIILTIETNDPAELARVASAISGVNADQPPQAPKKTAPVAAKEVVEAAKPVAQTQAPAAAVETVQATTGAIPTQAELTTAINSANAKLGNGGAARLKKFLSENFKAADGSPATLSKIQDSDKATLLAQLNDIRDGKKELPL